MSFIRKSFISALTIVGLVSGGLSHASQYPDKPIRIIVPFTVGGGSDAAARFFSERLTPILGQPAIVENRPGGMSGSIGTMAVKNAAPDGYTILVGSSSPIVINPLAVKDLPYDPFKDFRPVHGLTKNTTAIVVGQQSPYSTLADLITSSKKDDLNAGTASAGFHVAANWFGEVTGIKFTHVNYKGLSQVLTDVAGGTLDWAIVDLAGATPLIEGQKIRALAVTDGQRHPRFPDVPTVVESGYPEYVYNTWTSFHVRSETPDDIVEKLADAVAEVLAQDETKEYAERAGTELLPLGPREFTDYQNEEFKRFSRVAESTGFEPR